MPRRQESGPFFLKKLMGKTTPFSISAESYFLANNITLSLRKRILLSSGLLMLQILSPWHLLHFGYPSCPPEMAELDEKQQCQMLVSRPTALCLYYLVLTRLSVLTMGNGRLRLPGLGVGLEGDVCIVRWCGQRGRSYLPHPSVWSQTNLSPPTGSR